MVTAPMVSAPSAMSAVDWIHELLDLVGSGTAGHRTMRQCPAHPDRAPSLAVGVGRDGRVLLHCHAGCALEDILGALRLGPRHLYQRSALTPREHVKACRLSIRFPPVRHAPGPRRGGGSGKWRLSALHDYGRWQLLRYRHPTTGAKRLGWEHRGLSGAWVAGLGGVKLADLPLYEERQVRMGVAAGDTIIVVESESSVDALTKSGLYATTWAGGAQNPQLDRLLAVLGSARVLVVPDHDPAGVKCGKVVAEALRHAGARVETRLPDAPGMDARDLLRRDGPSAFEVGCEHNPPRVSRTPRPRT